MTSRHRHDNKQALREQASQKRLQAVREREESVLPAPELFQQPVKVEQSDKTAELAKNILGAYPPGGFDNSLLIGVSRAPPTPQPSKTGKTQPSFFPKQTPNGVHRKSGQKLELSADPLVGNHETGGNCDSKNSATRPAEGAKKDPKRDRVKTSSKWSAPNQSSASDRHWTKFDSHQGDKPSSPTKSNSAGGHGEKLDTERDWSRERTEKSRHSTPTKSSHRHSSNRSLSAGNSRHRDGHKSRDSSSSRDGSFLELHSPPPDSPPKTSGVSKPREPVLSQKLSQEESNSKEKDSNHTTMAPPNGTIPVNGLKKLRHIELPKIQIHKDGKHPLGPSSSVDDIIKEMTLIDTPLTGICTPHKEKNFPFPMGHTDTSVLQQVTKQLMDTSSHKGSHTKTQGSVLNDLEVSESESEVEDVKEQPSNGMPEDAAGRGGAVKMLSSSESEGSSESSSDSGSDSESSASDAEDDPQPKPQTDEPDIERSKPSPDNASNSPTDSAEQQKRTEQTWSLKNFVFPKTASNSIIGGDLGNSDLFKDASEAGLEDLSENVQKTRRTSSELLADLQTDVGLPGQDSDREPPPAPTRQPKKETKPRHRHRSSSNQDWSRSHKKSSQSRSPAGLQTKSPATDSKSPASKVTPQKTSETPKKATKLTPKANDVSVGKVSSSPAKAPTKPGKPRGRPKKLKTPVIVDPGSSEEEAMDVDVESITPEKKHADALRRNSLEKSHVPVKIDFSTPPRNDTFNNTAPKPLSPTWSSNVGTKTKDSERKDKKERKKHDKQSEDKRKVHVKSSPITDKETKYSNSDQKDTDMCPHYMAKDFRKLSPIPSVPQKSIPGVDYTNGKPSIVVRLSFSLLERIPSKDTDLKSPESGISTMSSGSSNPCTAGMSHTTALDSTDSREEDGPPDLLTDTLNDSAVEDIGDLPRLNSHKPELNSTESAKDTSSELTTAPSRTPVAVPDPSEDIIRQICDNRHAQHKRKRKYPKESDSKSDSKSAKSSSKPAKHSEPSPITENKSRDGHKSPTKSSERRSSCSSNSSHKDKAKRRKCDSPPTDKNVKLKIESPNVKQENGQSDSQQTGTLSQNDSTGSDKKWNSNSTQKSSNKLNAADEVSQESEKPKPDLHADSRVQVKVKEEPLENGQKWNYDRSQKNSHKLLPADEYISQAKKLKYEADSLSDKKQRSLIYTEAVLSFILGGYAMEEQLGESNRYFRMYSDTLALLKSCIHMGRLRSNHHDWDGLNLEKRLTVLSLRIQSLLCLKLFKLKKLETLKFKRAIDDHNKTSRQAASAPSPHQSSWNSRGTGTPSPMSPTPSPAGSIGSVCSQSSGCDTNPSKLANGNVCGGAVPSPGFVSVPLRIHSIQSQYISNTSYLVQAWDLWDQADTAANECSDFFQRLERDTCRLTLHSSIWELVDYVRHGLGMLKDT